MSKSKRSRGLSGTVLIMVLTVMFVLIIMLTATLTVVSTAGQRIYTKYEENQAYYTARSALDIYTQNLLGDNSYYAYKDATTIRTYQYTDDSGATPTVSAATNMKQGLALQSELYKIRSQGLETAELAAKNYPSDYKDASTGKPNTNAYSALGFAENMYETDDVFGNVDPSTSAPENKFFAVSPTAINNETADVTKPYIQMEYIEYEISFPKISGGSGDEYGKFVDIDKNDTDNDGNKTEQVAKIKVEVLDRIYDTSPAYTHEQMLTVIKTGSATDKADLKEAIKNGNRADDRYRLRITSTVQFMDTEGTAVLIIDSEPPVVNNSSKAVTTFGGSGSDNMNIIGGAAMADNVTWSNDGVVYGNDYAEKNLTMNTGAKVHLSNGESILIGGDFVVNNSNFQLIEYGWDGNQDNKPFLFVGGKLKSGNLSTSTSSNVDLITHGIEITGNYFAWNGDVYCLGDFDMRSANAVNITGNLYVQGKIYLTSGGATNFALKAGGIEISGITGNIYHTGDICEGIIGVDSIIGSPSYSVTTPQSMPATMTLPNLATDVFSPLADEDGVEITLPSGVKKIIPTHAENYNKYYVRNAAGKLVDSSNNEITNPATQLPVPISTESYAGVTGLDKTSIGASVYISSGDTIDTSVASPTGHKYILKPGSYGNITVKGGGTAEIVFEPTGNTWDEYTGNVYIDNDTTVKFFGPTGTYNFFNFYVYNEDTKDAVENGAVLNVGDKPGHGITVPKIHYYFGSGADVKLYNGAFLTGYFYGPGAMLSNNVAGKPVQMKYNGSTVLSHEGNLTVNMTVVGSVLCHKINFPNGNGIAYINPELDNDNSKEDPILDWKSYQYLRK